MKRKKGNSKNGFVWLGAGVEILLTVGVLALASSLVQSGTASPDKVYALAPLLCLPGAAAGAVLAGRADRRCMALLLTMLLPAFLLCGFAAVLSGKCGHRGILTACILLFPPLMGFAVGRRGHRRKQKYGRKRT